MLNGGSSQPRLFSHVGSGVREKPALSLLILRTARGCRASRVVVGKVAHGARGTWEGAPIAGLVPQSLRSDFLHLSGIPSGHQARFREAGLQGITGP